MKHIIHHILLTAIIVLATIVTSAPTWGQVQGSRKHGTVLEQLHQSRLYQPIDSAVLAATDYMGLYRSTCFWKEGLKGSFESRDSIAASNLIQEMLSFAATFTGTRYRYGATGPKAFDCSGFTSYVFRQFGYDLNRTSRQQIHDGEKIKRDELRPGDLVFFNGRAVNNRIGHVGIVTEVDSTGSGFSFIHASTSQGVCVSKYPEEAYYSKRYIGACRPIKQ